MSLRWYKQWILIIQWAVMPSSAMESNDTEARQTRPPTKSGIYHTVRLLLSIILPSHTRHAFFDFHQPYGSAISPDILRFILRFWTPAYLGDAHGIARMKLSMNLIFWYFQAGFCLLYNGYESYHSTARNNKLRDQEAMFCAALSDVLLVVNLLVSALLSLGFMVSTLYLRSRCWLY